MRNPYKIINDQHQQIESMDRMISSLNASINAFLSASENQTSSYFYSAQNRLDMMTEQIKYRRAEKQRRDEIETVVRDYLKVKEPKDAD
jgi:hypothetical protein